MAIGVLLAFARREARGMPRRPAPDPAPMQGR
jgi:hypothetical protein